MELQELGAAYRAAEAQFDADGCAACILRMMDVIRAHPELDRSPEAEYLNDGRLKMVLAAAVLAYERGEDRLAEYYLHCFPKEIIGRLSWLEEFHYVFGNLAMRRGAFAEAERELLVHVEQFPADERGWLALGTARARSGKFVPAVQAYARALACHPGMREAEENQARVLRCMMQPDAGAPLDLAPLSTELSVAAEDWEAVRRIPIFVNCRDRADCLSRFVAWLLAAGYDNILLLDNASTYAPLLKYYETVSSPCVRVVRLGANLGHEALWQCKLLDLMGIETPYVYTDPDVLPGKDCPPRFLQTFVRVLAAHPAIRKVGAALRYEDITFFDRERMQAWERTLWHAPIGKDVYFANVDTTFALYRPERSYHIGPALRLGGAYTFRHEPWYYDEAHLPEDEQYYRAHANASSTLSELAQEQRARP